MPRLGPEVGAQEKDREMQTQRLQNPDPKTTKPPEGWLARLGRYFFGKIEYPGYHCGCCGKWVNDVYFVPERMSVGWRWDTIGLCSTCAGVPNDETRTEKR
jgi:hypothetical protein